MVTDVPGRSDNNYRQSSDKTTKTEYPTHKTI